MKMFKWISIPVLLIVSLFACCAAGYEPLLDFTIFLGAGILMHRAIQAEQYFWATGLVAIGAVFMPFSLVVKIFFLLGLAWTANFSKLVVAFRRQPFRAT